MKKAVWTVTVFVLALMAVPVIGQDVVTSEQDDVRAEVTRMANRLDSVEAGQAKAKREALALQRKVAALGKSQDGLSVRATSLERATVAVGDRLNSVESLSLALDRRSADSKDQIANLVLESDKTRKEVAVLDQRSTLTLRLAILSLLPWGLLVGLAIVVLVWEFGTRSKEKPNKAIEPISSLLDVVGETRKDGVVQGEPSTLAESGPEHDDTTVLEMPSHDPSPTSSDLVLVDEAMARAHRSVRPIPMPAHRRD